MAAGFLHYYNTPFIITTTTTTTTTTKPGGCNSTSHIGGRHSWRIPVRKNARGLPHLVICSTSSPTSAEHGVILQDHTNISYENRKPQFNYLIGDQDWQVRRMVETPDEMRAVSDVQAEAFHEPVFLFDDLFFQFFKAEVLSGLQYRVRNSPPDRYACLVAEARDPPQGSEKEVLGVVDITVQRGDSILRHLPGADEYLYVSGIAVLDKYRRQKVGTALLKACDLLSTIWGFQYLVLRAYEDDHGARKLYSNAGYRVVSGDPPWMSSWIGRRRRVVMIKEIPFGKLMTA